MWANSKTIVAGSGKSDRLLGICFLREALEVAVEGIGEGERRGAFVPRLKPLTKAQS
ncbi:MAG: hypothetical protein ACI9UA_004885 [Pseudoalteromonas tetraodonis]